MSRPVFSFRPNPENPEHRKAWEILQSVPEGQKSPFLVQAILRAERASRLEELLRMAVREELMGSRLEGLLRRTVREELKSSQPEGLPRGTVREELKSSQPEGLPRGTVRKEHNGSHPEAAPALQEAETRDPEIPGQMLDFLSRLG